MVRSIKKLQIKDLYFLATKFVFSNSKISDSQTCGRNQLRGEVVAHRDKRLKEHTVPNLNTQYRDPVE